jgi:hypothetical protein
MPHSFGSMAKPQNGVEELDSSNRVGGTSTVATLVIPSSAGVAQRPAVASQKSQPGLFQHVSVRATSDEDYEHREMTIPMFREPNEGLGDDRLEDLPTSSLLGYSQTGLGVSMLGGVGSQLDLTI